MADLEDYHFKLKIVLLGTDIILFNIYLVIFLLN